ncbi:hypothetical protein KDH_11840 [Dictyobacter sp. S3.2.2.5]|uniref:S26 family signal peptidase n=1 Tax=Dictyobacter halimunensis TaxID=3026934 RepID=A0ABQ6FM60_9CHLR|nr:hypothetical protein KDH_11840 [Dictyobacter sp. S3.2.2.5]
MTDNQKDPKKQDTEETNKIRVDRFTWKPGDLVLVDNNPKDSDKKMLSKKYPKKQ